MNKYAAEKIAQEYYALGAQLALTKQANFSKGFYKAQNALLATLGGGVTAGLSTPHIKELLSKSDTISNSFAKRDQLRELWSHARRWGDEFSTTWDHFAKKAPGEWAYHDTHFNRANDIISDLESQVRNIGYLNATDDIINALPEALGIGAGLGVGAGIYKGLGKLDKKLKLY